jgi:toxin ParE1/3/4
VNVDKLAIFPYIGTKRDDLGENLRTVGYKKRVTIIFTADETEVVIYAILYGGRDLGKALL